jgi:NTP pyrophosphatase (non-canonical NTP hydrolase)
MAKSDLEELTGHIRNFARARDWGRYHTPKNLSMALIAEAAELVEHFQWLTPEESASLVENDETMEEVADEVADVAIYLLRLADVLDIDLGAAVRKKMDRNEERFPAG